FVTVTCALGNMDSGYDDSHTGHGDKTTMIILLQNSLVTIL
ncbi:hypothetical protein GCK32_008774, partial [Trichostrongylus colubriformis]